MKQLNNNDYNNQNKREDDHRVYNSLVDNKPVILKGNAEVIIKGNIVHRFLFKYRKFVVPVVLCIIVILIVVGFGLVFKHL